MVTSFQHALSTMRRTVLEHRGVKVTIQRNDGSVLVAVVNPAGTTEETESEEFIHRREKLQDFIIDAEYFNGTEPQRGESLVWGTKRFRFTDVPGGQLFDYHDAYRDSYRVHTIQVALDSEPIPPPDPPIDPPVDVFGYAPSNGTDTYGNHLGVTYAPP